MEEIPQNQGVPLTTVINGTRRAVGALLSMTHPKSPDDPQTATYDLPRGIRVHTIGSPEGITEAYLPEGPATLVPPPIIDAFSNEALITITDKDERKEPKLDVHHTLTDERAVKGMVKGTLGKTAEFIQEIKDKGEIDIKHFVDQLLSDVITRQVAPGINPQIVRSYLNNAIVFAKALTLGIKSGIANYQRKKMAKYFERLLETKDYPDTIFRSASTDKHGNARFKNINELMGNLFSFIVAGAGTTRAVMERGIFMLQNPSQQKYVSELIQELNDNDFAGFINLIKTDPNFPINRNLVQLISATYPKLHSWVLASLAASHPAPVVPKIALQNGTLGGVEIKEGDIVVLNINQALRIVMGETLFDPERILNDKDLQVKIRKLSFAHGGGSRCPGEPIAMIQLALVIGELATSLNWQTNLNKDSNPEDAFSPNPFDTFIIRLKEEYSKRKVSIINKSS